MVAGTSGAMPGSGAGGGDDEEKLGRLMLLQPARNIVTAAAIPRLATLRILLDLIMASPEQFVAAPVPQPSVKPLSEQ